MGGVEDISEAYAGLLRAVGKGELATIATWLRTLCPSPATGPSYNRAHDSVVTIVRAVAPDRRRARVQRPGSTHRAYRKPGAGRRNVARIDRDRDELRLRRAGQGEGIRASARHRDSRRQGGGLCRQSGSQVRP